MVTVDAVMVQSWLRIHLLRNNAALHFLNRVPLRGIKSDILYIQSKDHQEHCHCERGAYSRTVEAEVREGEGEE